jgi:hypothetical protein
MDSRILHTAFEKALQTVAWDKHGDNEYVQVGDGESLDEMRLQSLIDQAFTASVIWLSPDRHSAIPIPREAAARQIIDRIKPPLTISVSDEDVRVFLQVHPLCVARTGKAQANYSFKPNPLRGSA